MMIGPDTYYEINLKGKDKEYILSAIREMQDEIARLKELMENPDNKNRDIIHPSEEVQIKCTRDYIARAIQAYEELGGTYKMSKLEKADLEFQRNIGNISKITFEYSNGKDALEISGNNDYPYNFNEFAEIFDAEIIEE